MLAGVQLQLFSDTAKKLHNEYGAGVIAKKMGVGSGGNVSATISAQSIAKQQQKKVII